MLLLLAMTKNDSSVFLVSFFLVGAFRNVVMNRPVRPVRSLQILGILPLLLFLVTDGRLDDKHDDDGRRVITTTILAGL
jgi:hypothetical protein